MPRGYLKVFQYGSNMNAERLNSPERLNDKARVVGVARLEVHGVRFDLYSTTNRCGVTDIVAAGDEYVLGVLYDIPIRFVMATWRRSKMDTIEGAQPDGTGNYKCVRLKSRDGWTGHQRGHLCRELAQAGGDSIGGRLRSNG